MHAAAQFNHVPALRLLLSKPASRAEAAGALNQEGWAAMHVRPPTCSWGNSLARLTFLSSAFQFISGTGFCVLECPGNWLLQVANYGTRPPAHPTPIRNMRARSRGGAE